MIDEDPSPGDEQRRFWTMAGLVGGPILLLGLWLAFRPQAPQDLRLDPTPFQKDIEAMESVLFSGERLASESATALEYAMRGLSSSLSSAPMPSPAQRRASEGLSAFLLVGSTMVGQSLQSFDVPGQRETWGALREKYFLPAPWFRQSSAELQQAEGSAAAQGVPPDIGRYREAIDGMRLAISHVRSNLSPWPENPRDIDGAALSRWQAARNDLKSDMERTGQNFPIKLSNPSLEWGRAYEALASASAAARGLLSRDSHTGAEVVHNSMIEFRIQRLEYALTRAEEALASAMP